LPLKVGGEGNLDANDILSKTGKLGTSITKSPSSVKLMKWLRRK